MSDNIHQLAKARSECAAKLEALKTPNGAADPTSVALAEACYQDAEDRYQRALSLLTNAELIAAVIPFVESPCYRASRLLATID